MSILFGHPGGNPNSQYAALAHFEAGWLEAFCVPWMPTPKLLRYLREIPGLHGWVSRLDRRCFPPLLNAPRIEGRAGEWLRMLRRVAIPWSMGEKLSYEANDWLMRTMANECRRQSVTTVHSYEDCSLWQFEAAKRQNKLCVYDMPIGYYSAWEEKQRLLARDYIDWLPPTGLPSSLYVRPEQKRKEMELADLVLAPSTFVMNTIRTFYPEKRLALAPYGVDLDYWQLPIPPSTGRPLRFLYAGQISIRKGIPLLLDAWRKAGLKDALLELVGYWGLAPNRQEELPPGVTVTGPCSRNGLRTKYQEADVFVFPSFFEGFGLVILEAMACGLPVITTKATAGPDLLDENTGRIIDSGDIDALVDSLQWFSNNRGRLPEMQRAARAMAETKTWEHYRNCVREAVTPYIN